MSSSHSLAVAVRAALILLTIVGSARMLHAQAAHYDVIGGTTYVVAFPDTTTNTFDPRYPDRRFEDRMLLYIHSAVGTTVTIAGDSTTQQIAVSAGEASVVDVKALGVSTSPSVSRTCAIARNTLRITAPVPVVVYQYMATRFGTEAWTPLPVEAWGQEYHAAAHPGEIGSNISPGGEFDYNRLSKMFPAEILVIAAYDDTKISIVPNGAVLHFCNATNITLNAGEAYQIQSWVDTLMANVGGDQPDFGGSRIFSTKPVAVISGNTRAQLIDDNVGLGRNAFKNMLIEWLPPVTLHGTEFVYMPTWDGRQPTGQPTENPDEKRRAELVRIYGTSDATSYTYIDRGVSYPGESTIEQGGLAERRHTPNRAVHYRTDRPAQVMMSAPAIVRYAGTTIGFGGYVGAAYDAWGGYMIDMVPRERWYSFAPYTAPGVPNGLEHFLNVVTDSSHIDDIYLKNGTRVPMARRIEGTPYVWGSIALAPGSGWIEGRNGAEFYGTVYGTLANGGHEEYRPGAARDRGDDPPTGAAGDGPPEVLHPSEYEELLAIAYGYPLAAVVGVRGTADSLQIKTVLTCRQMSIAITALNANPVGLRSIRLDSAVNATIVSQSPTTLSGASSATVVIGPIDPLRDASAVVVVTDRSGHSTRIPYRSAAEYLALNPSRLEFGVLTPGEPITMAVTVTNPLDRPISIRAMRLALGGGTFAVKQPQTLPIDLAAGESISIVIEASAAQASQEYSDTLELVLSCASQRIVLHSSTENPCLTVEDLDFGTLSVGQSRTLPMRICNTGGGEVRFASQGSGVIDWLSASFHIEPSNLAMLQQVVLRSGDCITIPVTFVADAEGRFRTTARLWASTRLCRDTSVWSALVLPPASAEAISGVVTTLGANEPNPFGATTEIPFSLARGSHVTISLYDARGARVAVVLDGYREAGRHGVVVDASGLPAGVYHYRMSAGGFSRTRTMIRR